MPVTSKHRQVRELEKSWIRCRDVVGGPRPVKAKTTAYLPKLLSHQRGAGLYESYLERALFVPVAARTVRAFVGLVFSKDPQVAVPDKSILADVTLTGVPFADYARKVFREIIAPGRIGILVDMPPDAVPGIPARAAQRMYACDTVIDWREETVAQLRTRLAGVESPAFAELGLTEASLLTTHLRLLEQVEIQNPDDPFEHFVVDQVRVIDLVDVATDAGVTPGMRIQLWREKADRSGKSKRGTWEIVANLPPPTRRGVPVPWIPFVAINSTSVSMTPEECQVAGLCEINLSQYRTSADLENARWKMGHPQLAAFGVSDVSKLEIGDGIWTCDNPAGHIDVIQVQDQFGGLERAMAEKAEQMVSEGARLMSAAAPGEAETATAARLKAAGERSLLVTAAQAASQGMRLALAYQAWWNNGSAALTDILASVDVKLHDKFDEEFLTGADAEAWLRVQIGGGISKRTLRHILRKGEIYPNDWSDDLEAAAIEQDRAAALEEMPTDPSPLDPQIHPMTR